MKNAPKPLPPARSRSASVPCGVSSRGQLANSRAKRIAAGLEGHLTIGCVGSATYSLLPRVVRSLREELSDVDISVRGEMLAPGQITALLAAEIDVALLRPPVTHPHVAWEVLWRDPLLVALPTEHPLATRDRVDIRDLHAEDFISHAG